MENCGPRRTLDVTRLSHREREVADLIVQGLSNKEIAARLQIALPTVQRHVHNVLSKLAANSRLEVAAFCQDWVASTDAPDPPRPVADLVPTSPFELNPIPPFD